MSEGWRKIKPQGLYQLTATVAEPLRWTWRRWRHGGRNKLLLVAPRGDLWLFKAVGGMYLRPLDADEETAYREGLKMRKESVGQ